MLRLQMKQPPQVQLKVRNIIRQDQETPKLKKKKKFTQGDTPQDATKIKMGPRRD